VIYHFCRTTFASSCERLLQEPCARDWFIIKLPPRVGELFSRFAVMAAVNGRMFL
jgi:hypothetical protein